MRISSRQCQVLLSFTLIKMLNHKCTFVSCNNFELKRIKLHNDRVYSNKIKKVKREIGIERSMQQRVIKKVEDTLRFHLETSRLERFARISVRKTYLR